MENNIKLIFKYLIAAGTLFVFRHFMGFELAILLGIAFIDVDNKENGK